MSKQNTSPLKSSASVDLLADPEFKAFIDSISELHERISTLTLPEQRKQNTEFIINSVRCNESVSRIVNVEIPGPDNNKIPMRIYVPKTSTALPVMMYFHGGGWVFGCIEDHEPACLRFANRFGCIVASVDYRLAPEFPFPKPLEDCYAATVWMAKNAHQYGGNGSKLMVCGESAGGNLAGAVALMARDKHGPKLSGQILLYPVITSTLQDPVYENCPNQSFITKEDMRFFWDMYVQNHGQEKNPYASLECCSDLKGLPPALIITAEYDPLCLEGTNYARQLQNAGVSVVSKVFPKLIHGFFYIPLYPEQKKVQWTQEIGESLRKLGIL